MIGIGHPTYQNHNGGCLAFGPDGYLFIGTGDGGGGGDPNNNAQNKASLLGKLLRIDVDSASPYAIPPDNPFVGEPGSRPEIWAYGLRNPWRFSFDRVTGALWLADVGQVLWEEINYVAAGSPGGQNFGWRTYEASHCYLPTVGCIEPASYHAPFYEYGHTIGQSVTGGFVYRGSAMPSMVGKYFFGDFSTAKIYSLRYDGATVTDLVDHSPQLTTGFLPVYSLSSFGQDAAGELYYCNWENGQVLQMKEIPATPAFGPLGALMALCLISIAISRFYRPIAARW